MRLPTVLLSCCLAFGAGAAFARSLVPILYFDGFGPLRIGMTRAQLEAKGVRVAPDERYDPAHPQRCWQGTVEGLAAVTAMFEGSRLVRVSLGSPDFATLSGARTGMTEALVQAIYGGRLRVEPHQYDPDGHYLKLFSSDGRRALVMESDGAKVHSIHAGEARPAQYVEGCL